MNEIKWPNYDWEVYGKPLHCEQALDNLGNEYVTTTLNVVEEGGKYTHQHRDRHHYEVRLKLWVERGYIKVVPYDYTPFEGNV